jgi:hypothetical protein
VSSTTDLGRAISSSPGAAKRLASVVRSLRDLGWFRSAAEHAPVDRSGRPIPWYSYAAISWLQDRVEPGLRVFEYGAGNSTLWWESVGARVTAVEHDRQWADTVAARVGTSTEVRHEPCRGDALTAPDDDPYVNSIDSVEGPLDVIVVDGRARLRCMEKALAAATPSTIILLDNADRTALAPALAGAGAEGHHRVDFTSPAPGSGRLSTTAVFSRDLSRWTRPAPPLRQVGYD